MTTATLKPLPLADTSPLDGISERRPAASVKADRLVSLDVFRGITIATMLLVNNPGSWSHVHGPLRHAEWHGWTMTDLVFPFFLFIVGVAIPFSMAKRAAAGVALRGQLLAGVWSRALSLVLLGLLLAALPRSGGDALPDGYNSLRVLRVVAEVFCWFGFLTLLFPWPWRRVSLFAPIVIAVLFVGLYWALLLANRQALQAGIGDGFKFGGGILTPWRMRFPGVLQRIGVCYGIAATIAVFAGWRTILASAVVLMGIYSGLMLAAPYPGHERGSLEKEDNFARKVDEKVFGFSRTGGRNHNYSYPDNEGLVSTLPAIGNVLLGILVGLRLRSDRSPAEKAASVLAWGVAVALLGVLLGWWLMPVNKVIWTPSYAVLTVGLGMLGLGAVYYVADVRGRRAWALPFRIYGMNAILAFVLAGGVLGRISSWIDFTNPRTQESTHAIPYLRGEVAHGMHVVGDWLVRHVQYPPGVFDSPKNVSLAEAVTFVLIILVPLTILYFCRVFVKV